MRSMQVKMCISDTCYFWEALFYLVKLVSMKRIAKVKLTSGHEASEANVPAPVAITSSGFSLTMASFSNMFKNKLSNFPFPSRCTLITFWYLPFLSVWAQTMSLLTKVLPTTVFLIQVMISHDATKGHRLLATQLALCCGLPFYCVF